MLDSVYPVESEKDNRLTRITKWIPRDLTSETISWISLIFVLTALILAFEVLVGLEEPTKLNLTNNASYFTFSITLSPLPNMTGESSDIIKTGERKTTKVTRKKTKKRRAKTVTRNGRFGRS